MQLTPHYGAEPLLGLDGDPAAISEPTIRQRRRLANVLAEFTEQQWHHPSRCAGWTSRDVVVHLDSTNFFWIQSIASGLRGEPTRYLATFDPVSSPAHSVGQSHDLSPAEVLERFAESTETLAKLLESLDADDWNALAEAPPGHLTVSTVTHHALWDAWVHERDILEPLGIEQALERDEAAASLRYAAALGPALAITRGHTGRGRLGVIATDPDVAFVVDIADHVSVVSGRDDANAQLVGPTADLIDQFSIRQPFRSSIPPEHRWMLGGLAETFDEITP